LQDAKQVQLLLSEKKDDLFIFLKQWSKKLTWANFWKSLPVSTGGYSVAVWMKTPYKENAHVYS